MAFSITNRAFMFAPVFMGAGESTAQQYLGTATNTSTALAGPYFEFGDYTTTGSIPGTTQMIAGGPGDFGSARMCFRAFVNFKAYSAATQTGTSTFSTITGPLMTLEAATSTSFAPLYVLDYAYLPTAASTAFNGTSTAALNAGGPSKILSGILPVNTGAQFARLTFYANGPAGVLASSTGVDAIIQAA